MDAVSAKNFLMPPEELDRFMAEVKAWSKERHGRQKDLAKKMDVSEALLSNWIARRKTPSIENYFRLKAIFEELKAVEKLQRRRKS